MAGALDDIRVLDVAGPIGHYAGRLLADLGADVIKVEPPGGDAARGYPPFLPDVDPPENGLEFLLLNANKRGVTVDLARPAGRDVFLRLVATSDVVLESWRPQEAEALQLTGETLLEARPDLIHASVTGWGLTGPRAQWAYADIVGVAMSGVMTLAGFPDGPPEQLPYLQGYHCASINAAAGVLAALLHRDATEEGQRVEVSMQEALSMAQETAMQTADVLGTDRARNGGLGSRGISMPGLGLYQCSDGYVYMMAGGVGAGSGFRGLMELMDESGDATTLREEPLASFIEDSFLTGEVRALLMTDPERAEALGEPFERIDEAVTSFILRRPKRWLYEEGQKRRVLIGMVSTPQDISRSPQLQVRDWFVEIDDRRRGTRLRYPGPPWQFEATPATLRRPAPLLGEHNEELFGEIGLEPALVCALARAGVV